MTIGELVSCLPQAVLQGDPNRDVRGIAYDSRQVRPGDLFVCIKGFRFDGHAFMNDALERGAVGLVVEESSVIPGKAQCGREGDSVPIPDSIPVVCTEDTRRALGLLGACFYDHPSRKLRLIGITGTKGKTTTTYLIKSILETAGHRVGLIGTIQNMIGDTQLTTERTTPESVDLQSLFSQMIDNACDYAVMEVSSHALKLQRTIGSEFDIGVFTNLSQDHLDFHPSFQDYLDTKTCFFTSLGIEASKKEKAAVLNYDEKYYEYIEERTRVPVITYGTREGATYRAQDIAIRPNGLTYRLEHPGGEVLVDLPMTGYYNAYNSLAALSTCLAVGISLPMAVKGLKKARPVPGRLEPIERGQDFTVLVDYAHNPASLENVLETVKGLTGGRSIVVFGCGGASSNTVISPQIHRDFCLPYDRKLHEALHQAGHKVAYHTCGGMTKILDLIVANGCDASETLSPKAIGGDITDPAIVKEAIGDQVCLIGGMDQFNILTYGSPEDIRREVHRLFAALGEGGGYILSASDHFFDTPKENLVAFAKAAHECVY